MPVRNASAYLEECLQSIISQTEKRWELLAINDHSSDDSFEILQTHASKDNRIKVFQNDGKGIIHALQLALKNSNGQFITRMDADDIMLLEKLVRLKNQLLKKGKGHVCTALVEYISETSLGDGYRKYQNWLNDLTSKNENFSDIYKECVIPSPCWMVFREDLLQCDAFDSEIYPEDYDLVFRFYKNGLKVTSVLEPLHQWRDYAERSSRTDPHYADQSFLDLKIKYFQELDFDKTDSPEEERIKFEEILENRKKWEILSSRLNQLSDVCQKIIKTYYWEKDQNGKKLSWKAISKRMGYSSDQVAKNTFKRCMIKLAE